MGATPKYGLPWPDGPALANGPDGFQKLATATENAIVSSIYTPSAPLPAVIVNVDNNQAGSTTALVTGATWAALGTGKSLSFSNDCALTMITNFYCNSLGNSAGQVNLYWDNVLFNSLNWHTRGHTQSQVAGLSLFNVKAGLHTLKINVVNNAGGSQSLVSMDLDWNIYTLRYPAPADVIPVLQQQQAGLLQVEPVDDYSSVEAV